MTNYQDGFEKELTEEQKERSEQNRLDHLKLKEQIDPLLSDIEEYVVFAKYSKGIGINKKRRNNLLKRIGEAEKRVIDLGQEYYDFNPDDERIRVLGAYSLVRMKKGLNY